MALTHSKPIRLLSLSKALTVTCSANMYQKGIIAQEYAVIGESNRTCAVFSTFFMQVVQIDSAWWCFSYILFFSICPYSFTSEIQNLILSDKWKEVNYDSQSKDNFEFSRTIIDLQAT